MLQRTRLWLVALCALTLLAPAALAQTAGEVLWKTDLQSAVYMSQPHVAPDGTIYVVTDQLYAIAPDGGVLWTAPAFQSYVDVGPDGTVYTSSINTIYAYNPDGSLAWSFTESPTGAGIMAGPTIGPDGNVYAISDLPGLGTFSLTPEGEFRWNVQGFIDNNQEVLGRVVFGPDNVYFAEDWAPGCSNTGLASISLDGEVNWCLPLSVVRPQATLDGRALVWQGTVSGRILYAYDPDGSLDWSHTFGYSPTGIGSVAAGPDNHLYVFHNLTTLAKLTADGAVLWEAAFPALNVVHPWQALVAVVAPDLSAVVFGSDYAYGDNGEIVAADPADGSTLWSLPVTGPSAGAGAPAAFSPDGSVVYVPVSTLSPDVPDELWAIQVRDATAAPVAVEAEPVGDPITLGPGGGSFQYTVTLTNQTAQPQSFEAWTAVTGPVGREPVVGPMSVTLPAGATLTRTLTQRIPGNAPAGTYTYAVNVGTLGEVVTASDSFPFEKTGGAGRGAGTGDWSVSGWDEAASASAVLPGSFALGEPAPNPSRGGARLALEFAEGQLITAAAFDALGRVVAVLHEGVLEAGAHTLVFDGSALPAGVYVVRVTGEGFTAARRVTLLK